jgi:hypothetical protein
MVLRVTGEVVAWRSVISAHRGMGSAAMPGVDDREQIYFSRSELEFETRPNDVGNICSQRCRSGTAETGDRVELTRRAVAVTKTKRLGVQRVGKPLG